MQAPTIPLDTLQAVTAEATRQHLRLRLKADTNAPVELLRAAGDEPVYEGTPAGALAWLAVRGALG